MLARPALPDRPGPENRTPLEFSDRLSGMIDFEPVKKMAALVAKSLQCLAGTIEQASLRVNQRQVNINEYVRAFHKSAMRSF
jgi:hypothetical protein